MGVLIVRVAAVSVTSLVLVCASFIALSDQGIVEPSRSKPVGALVSSFGMNTHLQQGWQYADAAKTVAALHELGIDQVRDSFTGLGNPALEYAARQGIKLDFIISAGWGTKVIGALEDWEKTYPGSISAIEGPNEVNNWPVTYNGRTGIPAAQAFQRDLYNGVHASPILKRIPVLALTSWPVFENKSDIGNIHAYARSGAFITPDVKGGILDETTRNPPMKPIWMTEAGYHTHIGTDHDEGVSEAVQAKMVLSLYLSAFEQGIRKTFLYQLLNQYDDPNDEGSHFGLVDQQWRRKPAFLALRNLIATLKKAEGPVSPTARLKYDLRGLPPTAHHLLLQAASDTWVLAIWNEPALWDRKTKRELSVAATSITLLLGEVPSVLALFDPLVGTEPMQTSSGVRQFEIPLTDHPLLLEIRPGPTKGTVAIDRRSEMTGFIPNLLSQ